MRRKKRMTKATMINDPADGVFFRRTSAGPLRFRAKQAWRVLRGKSVAIGNSNYPMIQTNANNVDWQIRVTPWGQPYSRGGL